MMASMQTSLLEREPLYLNSSDIDFNIIVNNEQFDNDDNPYGEFKAVIYNSMNGTTIQQIVPLKRNCSKVYDEDSIWYTSKYRTYCPDFSDQHYLKNDYYADASSWFRLILFECDPQKRKCASKSEIGDFFQSNLLEIQLKEVKPALNDYSSGEPVSSKYVTTHYSVRNERDLVWAKEFFIS